MDVDGWDNGTEAPLKYDCSLGVYQVDAVENSTSVVNLIT